MIALAMLGISTSGCRKGTEADFPCPKEKPYKVCSKHNDSVTGCNCYDQNTAIVAGLIPGPDKKKAEIKDKNQAVVESNQKNIFTQPIQVVNTYTILDVQSDGVAYKIKDKNSSGIVPLKLIVARDNLETVVFVYTENQAVLEGIAKIQYQEFTDEKISTKDLVKLYSKYVNVNPLEANREIKAKGWAKNIDYNL